MSWQSYQPHPGQATNHFAASLIGLPAGLCLLLGAEGLLAGQQWALLPSPTTPRANALILVVFPVLYSLFAIITLKAPWKSLRPFYLTVAVTGSVIVAWVSVMTTKDTMGCVSFYFIPIVAISYLWRPAVSIPFSLWTIGWATWQFYSLEEPPIAAIFSLTMAAVLLGATLLIGHSRTAHDSTEKKLLHMINTDPLTQVESRQAFHDALDQLATHATSYTIAVVDVDSFKSINDSYGHPAGDAALAHIGNVLGSCMPRSTRIFRTGGDEFALLDEGTPSDVRVGLRQATHSLRLGEKSCPVPSGVNISFGLAVGTRKSPSPSLVYAEADRRLYMAQQAKKNLSTHGALRETHLPPGRRSLPTAAPRGINNTPPHTSGGSRS